MGRGAQAQTQAMINSQIAQQNALNQQIYSSGQSLGSTKTNTQPNTMNPYWIVVALSSLVQCFIFLRWLHRRTRDDEIRRAFIRDMAINHLPHLYHALRQIAGHLGLELEDPPHVRFMELNGQDSKR